MADSADDVHLLILAAGKGTRMKARVPKVLHRLNGRRLIDYVLDTAEALSPASVTLVIGHQGDEVRSALSGRPGLQFAVQEPQLGTGHAVLQARPFLEGRAGTAVLLSGTCRCSGPRRSGAWSHTIVGTPPRPPWSRRIVDASLRLRPHRPRARADCAIVETRRVAAQRGSRRSTAASMPSTSRRCSTHLRGSAPTTPGRVLPARPRRHLPPRGLAVETCRRRPHRDRGRQQPEASWPKWQHRETDTKNEN
jgi:hypothetical protein